MNNDVLIEEIISEKKSKKILRQSGNNINIKINNINFSYNDEGDVDAPVIFFIHGFPFNKFMWKIQMEKFKENYRVISYDVRGHGNTEIGNEEFSLELFVTDLIALMDTLNIKKTTLCGLSMGGYIALRAYEKFPNRFDALVLCDTHCIADSNEVKEKRMKTIESIKKNGILKFANETIKNLFAKESFINKKEEVASILEMMINTSRQSLNNTLIAFTKRKETCSKLLEINIPVLIMVGKEDKITPPEASEFLHKNIRNSSLRIIEHSGHLSSVENPTDFNKELKSFVELVYV